MSNIYVRIHAAMRCRRATEYFSEQLGEVIQLMEHNKFVKAFSEIQTIKEKLETWAPDKHFDDDMETVIEWINDD